MLNVAKASLNTLPYSAVSPTEPFITISLSQLQDIIAQSVKKAVEPLQSRVEDLEEKISDLRAEQDHQAENGFIQLQLINQLRDQIHKGPEPGQTELARAEKIERYLAARPDHRASFETLRGHLGIDRILLNQAIKSLMSSSPDRYGIIKVPGDKRKRTLVMLPK